MKVIIPHTIQLALLIVLSIILQVVPVKSGILDGFPESQVYFMPGEKHLHRNEQSKSLVAIVMPIHEPKFPQAKRFALSLFACEQSRNYAYYPVLSNNITVMKLYRYFIGSSLGRSISKPIVVTHPEGHWCFRGLTNETGCDRVHPQYGCAFSTTACICGRKKLLAMNLLFTSSGNTHKYALAIDGDSEVQSQRDFTPWFHHWSKRKHVIGWPVDKIPPEHGYGEWTKPLLNKWWGRGSAASCNAIHQPNFKVWTWWGNAPVYEREDYSDFFHSIDFNNYLLNYALIFDHMTYMCYKVAARGWKLLIVNQSIEFSTIKEQNAVAGQISSVLSSRGSGLRWAAFPPYFLWSMEPSPMRLIRYNMDREGPGDLGLKKRRGDKLQEMLDQPLRCDMLL